MDAEELKDLEKKVRLSGWFSIGNAVMLRTLIKEQKVDTALEIGTYCGLSTLLLAQNCLHVTTVDTFAGSSEPYLNKEGVKKVIDNQLDIFLGNMRAFGVSNYSLIMSDSASAFSKLKEKFDLTYIDGSHIYEDVVNDIESAKKCTKKVICGDDYTNNWRGVKRAVDECLPDRKVFANRFWYYICNEEIHNEK